MINLLILGFASICIVAYNSTFDPSSYATKDSTFPSCGIVQKFDQEGM